MFLANCSRFHKFSQLSQFSSRNKGFLFISPTGKPPIRAVPPIFRTSTCLWDNRNRFVSKKITKMQEMYLEKQFQQLKTRQAGWPMQTEIIVSENYLLAAKSLGIRFFHSDINGQASDSCTASSSAKNCLGRQSAIKKIRS